MELITIVTYVSIGLVLLLLGPEVFKIYVRGEAPTKMSSFSRWTLTIFAIAAYLLVEYYIFLRSGWITALGNALTGAVLFYALTKLRRK